MKYFAVILTALLAIGQAASVPQQAAALDSLILETTVDKPTFNTTELIDGRRRISFYSNGVFAGSLTEGKPGSADNLIYVDPFSNTVSESELLATSTQLGGGAGTADVLATKPSSLSKLLEKFAALTKKYGPRFFKFLVCVGGDVGLKCTEEILKCAQAPKDPWQCLDGIICGGKAFHSCV